MLNEQLYSQLSKRTYKEFEHCQFPGCIKPIGKGMQKYCSKEHSKKAQHLYRTEWDRIHLDKKRLAQQKWLDKQKAKQTNNYFPAPNYEN